MRARIQGRIGLARCRQESSEPTDCGVAEQIDKRDAVVDSLFQASENLDHCQRVAAEIRKVSIHADAGKLQHLAPDRRDRLLAVPLWPRAERDHD